MTERIAQHPDLPLFSSPKKSFSFTFNGKTIEAHEGDTVASALIAAGVRITSRSFKYHRPRGPKDNFGQGPELLMTVDHAPNVRSDMIPVRAGMQVETQNAWPSTQLDLMSINNFAVPLLPNGFYYKMFHKPKWLWPIAERFIRKAAGLGKIDTQGRAVDTRYEKRYRFPDVCVVGSGPAGLASVKAALDAGKQVLLIEEQEQLGGHSRHTVFKVENCREKKLNGLTEQEAVRSLIDEIEKHPNLEILSQTQAFAVYEDNLVAAQRGTELFKIRAISVVFAPGATDRHLVFDNNDKPGIMTGRGVERLIALHGIKPARRAVVITTHDGGYHTAKLLHGAGTEVLAVVDGRQKPPKNDWVDGIRKLGIPIFEGKTIHRVKGLNQVKKVEIGDLHGQFSSLSFACDLVVLAVGYQPQLNLLSQGRTRPVWDKKRQILRVTDLPQNIYAAGEVQGSASFARLYQEGFEAGRAAAQQSSLSESQRDENELIEALPADIESGGKHHFICPCMDVTRSEACHSIEEGFDQVETLKRYSSMGMGPCQGKTCHEAVARLAARDTGLSETEAVPTTMRPPLSPVSFGILAGRAPHLVPQRRTAMHHCHRKAGAAFLNAGQWKRPHSYLPPQEEALMVRKGLGIIDVSTLGKLELSGPDVMDFLHFMLPGKFRQLAVGRVRYSTMIGEDGILFEDGTISHLEEGVYYLSTTTGNQAAIESLFRWWVLTDQFKVHIKNLAPVHAAVNVAGEKSREFIQKLVDIDMSNEAFPYMACRKSTIADVPVLLFRIGFTGELGYEIHFPSEFGAPLWEYFLEQGKSYPLKPFGVETQRILRLEKGHLIPGVDTDALSNPYEAGVDFTVKEDKENFVGKAFLKNFKERGIENKLVSYKLNSADPIPEDGVAILKNGKIIGRVTSSRMSPTLGFGIGLAWVPRDLSGAGSRFQIRLANGQDVTAETLDHAAYDPQGERLTS
ncbi:MAG: FAD-dependent oxidoreductase [SAR324 cluster bacterium]|nr:FAD-dependent oxidoreductase [SAR324 cluster bacterium]